MVKTKEKGINLKVSTARGAEVYDEIDVMEWDITKRPNLGFDHNTNKYYHQQQTTSQEKNSAIFAIIINR